MITLTIWRKKNISQDVRLKNIDETKEYFIKETMSKMYKKVCKILNYIEHLHLLILASTVTECISISAFSSLVDIHVGVASSAVGIKNVCVMTSVVDKYKTIIKKKRKSTIKYFY